MVKVPKQASTLPASDIAQSKLFILYNLFISHFLNCFLFSFIYRLF